VSLYLSTFLFVVDHLSVSQLTVIRLCVAMLNVAAPLCQYLVGERFDASDENGFRQSDGDPSERIRSGNRPILVGQFFGQSVDG
jgi:hypothetical protein